MPGSYHSRLPRVAATALLMGWMGAAPDGISAAFSVGAAQAATSAVRPDALNNIPHLAEINWETDLPSLLTIRFMPEKRGFAAGWSSWSLSRQLQAAGYMDEHKDPWPPFFAAPAKRGLPPRMGQLKPDDLRAFQD